LHSLQEGGYGVYGPIKAGAPLFLKQPLSSIGQKIGNLEYNPLIPEIEKELETYKQQRMKSIDQTVMTIIQKASQEIFNKSLSAGDHQSIVIDALEKAKKEGVFD